MTGLSNILKSIVITMLLAAPAQFPGAASSQRPAGPPPGPGGPGGPGRAGPGPGQEIKLVGRFDRDGDKRLNAAERDAARAVLATERPAFGRRGGPPPMPEAAVSSEPALRVSPEGVRRYDNEPLYSPSVLRTIFLTFERPDWEDELMAFANTDVEVPAGVVVDGRTLREVGVHFRGSSSLFTVPKGRKHSLNLSLDFVHGDQQLGGYRTLNLLNAHTDPTFLRTVLYSHIARQYIPAPNANFARVVINGEDWGIYVNAQQFNKDFASESFRSSTGARWKVPGSPGARGGLEYLGDDVSQYKQRYEIKSKDDAASWSALIALCRTLNETPADRLEAALAPMLDVDGALKFLALDAALVNQDGYWVRASDYNLYRDDAGRFHVIPHDTNETFGGGSGGRGAGPGRGPGGGPAGFGRGPGAAGPRGGMRPGPDGAGMPGGRGRGGPGGGGVTLDPLAGLDDDTKPLRSKLLVVPALREKYLSYVREIADTWLDWRRLEPLVQQYRSVIDDGLRRDTRKLDSFEAFVTGIDNLKEFADKRKAFLIKD